MLRQFTKTNTFELTTEFCTTEVLYEVQCLKSNEDMILALAGQFKQLSHDITFMGKHEPNKLTCSQLCDFVAQLVRALNRHCRGHGFESF